jgi:predicted aspartyl protease
MNSQLILTDGLIDASIDDKPVRLFLDTGSFTTVLTPAAEKRLGLRVDPDTSSSFRGIQDPWIGQGIGGGAIYTEVMAKTFRIGKITGYKFHFLTGVRELGDADGLLSTDFLKDYDIDLDFAGNQVRLFRAYGDCSHTKVFLQSPVFAVPLQQDPYDRRPRVEVFVGDRRLVALIDTGASKSAIFRNAADALGLNGAELAMDRTVRVHGIGPDAVAAKVHILPTLSVGELTLRNMRVDILDDRSHNDVDMLLGRDFQRRLHLWISNSAHELIMQYPPQASPDWP